MNSMNTPTASFPVKVALAFPQKTDEFDISLALHMAKACESDSQVQDSLLAHRRGRYIAHCDASCLEP